MERTALVIEDSPVIQRLIEVCLRPAGFRIETADDGGVGLAAARELKPDVVILDVGLPVLDGWQVLDALQSDPETTDIRVLVLTAHAQDELRAQASGAGAAGFLTKPFRPDDLRAAVIGLFPAVATTEGRTA